MGTVVDEMARDFDTTVVYGKETTVDRDRGKAAKRFPMMGAHQLIVVKEAQYLDRSIDQLASYCAAPQPQSVLVLCYKHKKLDKRKKVYKAIASNGQILETKPLYDNQVGGWIEQRGKGYGFVFSPKHWQCWSLFWGVILGR